MEISDIDLAELFEALDSERQARGLSWTGLTREINALFGDVPCPPIATSTIKGLKRKPEVIANAALQAVVWLGRSPESFMQRQDGPRNDEALPRLKPDRILRADTLAIFRTIDEVRRERDLTWQQVADEVGGVTKTQLTRLAKGAGIGFVALGRVAQWLNRSVASLTMSSSR